MPSAVLVSVFNPTVAAAPVISSADLPAAELTGGAPPGDLAGAVSD
jgi:hypothetical protein